VTQSLTFAISDQPDHGTLTGFNASTGAVTYDPADNYNGPDSFQFTVTDDTTAGGAALTSAAATVAITVNPVNDAPVLAPAAPLLPLPVNDADPAGITVASLTGSSLGDVDAGALPGIAIIAATGTTTGRWQFSTDGLNNWTSFGTLASTFGKVSSSRALLLDANHRLRYLPNPGYTLITSAPLPAILYRAWDQTSGSAGQPKSIVAVGGTTAFSVQMQTARVRVNDAPVLTSAARSLGPTASNRAFTATVAALLGSSVTDVGTGTRQGIAVTGLTTSAGGRWQFSLDGGATFFDFGMPAESAARLLRATDRVRYVPRKGATGTATITFRAWDQTTHAAGRLVDLTVVNALGLRAAFSTATDVAILSVT
jgi:hypothetical protein